MDIQNLFSRLRGFSTTLPALVDHVSTSDSRWKPADGAWSILEIVCHLADEEVDDFRARVRSTLETPRQEWAPIDPEMAAIQRNYNDGNLSDAIERFVYERNASVAWLQDNLDDIAEHSDQAYEHPRFGPITVGELFGSWVAHDQLHIRQISKRLYQMTNRDAAPYSTRYAGD
jgi:hypothetical protein